MLGQSSVALAERAPTPEDLMVVAAAPLEDTIRKTGDSLARYAGAH